MREARGASLVVNPPTSSEVVIRADKPWEEFMITFYLSVIDDGGKLRMWYICRDRDKKGNLAYAESTDGVHWTKPNVGVVEYRGSDFGNADARALCGPVTVTGDRLLLNLDTGALGTLRLGLRTDQGEPIPGFQVEDAVPVRGNATGVAVQWKQGSSLSALRSRTVQIEVSGARVKLYSFRFE